MIEERFKSVMNRIRSAAESCGRSASEVGLVAVAKNVDADRIREAIRCGVNAIGENYIQEARKKLELLGSPADHVSFHFIGHLQTNKAKYAVRLFDMIQSVDSFKLARAIDEQASKTNKIQDVLIQINVGDEARKSGVAFQETEELVYQMGQLNHVALKGFMAIPPYFDDPERTRPYLSAIREFRNQIAVRNDLPSNAVLDELSMGMTNDFEIAVTEGATIVRIGTAIFGERD